VAAIALAAWAIASSVSGSSKPAPQAAAKSASLTPTQRQSIEELNAMTRARLTTQPSATVSAAPGNPSTLKSIEELNAMTRARLK
jgi:hypothetical protein